MIEKIEKITKELIGLQKAYSLYPDITEYRDRWRSYYVSKMAEKDMTDVVFGASCGCCFDAIQYARPYIKIDGISIFSNPTNIDIGKGQYEGGIIRDREKEWHERVKDMNPIITEKIEKYLSERNNDTAD